MSIVEGSCEFPGGSYVYNKNKMGHPDEFEVDVIRGGYSIDKFNLHELFLDIVKKCPPTAQHEGRPLWLYPAYENLKACMRGHTLNRNLITDCADNVSNKIIVMDLRNKVEGRFEDGTIKYVDCNLVLRLCRLINSCKIVAQDSTPSQSSYSKLVVETNENFLNPVDDLQNSYFDNFPMPSPSYIANLAKFLNPFYDWQTNAVGTKELFYSLLSSINPSLMNNKESIDKTYKDCTSDLQRMAFFIHYLKTRVAEKETQIAEKEAAIAKLPLNESYAQKHSLDSEKDNLQKIKLKLANLHTGEMAAAIMLTTIIGMAKVWDGSYLESQESFLEDMLKGLKKIIEINDTMQFCSCWQNTTSSVPDLYVLQIIQNACMGVFRLAFEHVCRNHHFETRDILKLQDRTLEKILLLSITTVGDDFYFHPQYKNQPMIEAGGWWFLKRYDPGFFLNGLLEDGMFKSPTASNNSPSTPSTQDGTAVYNHSVPQSTSSDIIPSAPLGEREAEEHKEAETFVPPSIPPSISANTSPSAPVEERKEEEPDGPASGEIIGNLDPSGVLRGYGYSD